MRGWAAALVVVVALGVGCFKRGRRRAGADGGAGSGPGPGLGMPLLPGLGAEGEPRAGGVARLYLEVEPAQLNPLLEGDGIVARLTWHNLYEGLLRKDPVTGVIGPALAEGFVLSADGKQLDLTLRNNVTFHDGRALTMADVTATLALAASKDGPAAAWAADLEGTSVVVIDERHLSLRFERAQFSRLDALAHLMILPAGKADQPLRAPVGTGPFQLESWRGGVIRLARNPRYWGRRPWLDAVEYRVVADRAQAVELLRRGELDLVWHVTADIAAGLEGEAGLRLVTYAPPQALAVVWNCRRPALADARVRQAFDLAADRRAVVAALAGRAWPIAGPFLPGTPPGDAAPPPAAPDPAAARARLAAAGQTAPALTLLLPAGSRTAPPVAALLREDWARAGARVELREVPWGDLVGALHAHDFDAALLTEQTGVEPDLYPLFHSSQAATGDNRGGCSSPAVDARLEAVRAELDPARRSTLERDLARDLGELAPMLFLAIDARTAVLSPRLRGARPTLEWFWPRDMWIAP